MNVKNGDKFKALMDFSMTNFPIKYGDLIRVHDEPSPYRLGRFVFKNIHGSVLCTTCSRNGKRLIRDGIIKKIGSYNKRKLSPKRLP